ncbi:fumarate reductase iron-sulfur subunit [Motiliproteus sediminis]|uniref:fumarate reductase iron-sulfur subunit n=1 Tax=Motiliproteus sediminis TaxID=1468178 RepID=UPI001AEF3752|nr:fumarate reductase iron-sulfur subunit [Motiliproteus sediminis]
MNENAIPTRSISADDCAQGRLLTLNIMRYDPQVKGDSPRMVSYQLREAPGMTLFIALNEIREQQDPSLKFDFVCRAGICGSCSMVINGRPGLACRTLTAGFSEPVITLLPLPGFELIGDLSVNTGRFMRELSERIGSWIEAAPAAETIDQLEAPMEPELAEQIYELDRCIQCSCCIAACGTRLMREDFVGAVAFIQVARFRLDPRDQRSDEEWYQIIGNDQGVFGCMSLLGCEDLCPKDLPHQTQIAFLRRKMAGAI